MYKMYESILRNAFSKDVKLSKRRGLDISLLEDVMDKLINGQKLEEKYRDHLLTGDYAGMRECHIKPDWLLVYYYSDEFVVFARTGTHSDLFDK